MSDQHIETAAEQTGVSQEIAAWVVAAWLDSVGLDALFAEAAAMSLPIGLAARMDRIREAIRAVQP